MKFTIRHLFILFLFLGIACLYCEAHTSAELHAALSAAKASPKNQALNTEAADMLKAEGRLHEAIPFYLKGGNSGNLSVAEIYFLLYDYDKAEEYLDKYLAKRTKTEAANDRNFSYGNDSEAEDWTDVLRARIELGRSMLDRVEKIQIVDSINVPAETFFRFYRLARSAGSLVDDAEIEKIVKPADIDRLEIASVQSPAFISEAGDDVIWSGADNLGNMAFYESTRLSDETFDSPTLLFDYEKIFGDTNGSIVAYPFLMADGMTLYFAADGENSLGDLDIFISRRDSDGFLQPSNIGMPYNSPYNDYLYAIDEQTGTGWWATDRNLIEDSVTIYTFIPQDLRINYAPDTPRISDYARIASIAETQVADTDYDAIRRRIKQLSADTKARESSPSFSLALPNGKVIHSLSSFTNRMAASTMQKYLAAENEYEKESARLAELRKRYARGEKTLGRQILSLENALEEKREELKRLRNHVVTLECDD